MLNKIKENRKNKLKDRRLAICSPLPSQKNIVRKPRRRNSSILFRSPPKGCFDEYQMDEGNLEKDYRLLRFPISGATHKLINTIETVQKTPGQLLKERSTHNNVVKLGLGYQKSDANSAVDTGQMKVQKLRNLSLNSRNINESISYGSLDELKSTGIEREIASRRFCVNYKKF